MNYNKVHLLFNINKTSLEMLITQYGVHQYSHSKGPKKQNYTKLIWSKMQPFAPLKHPYMPYKTNITLFIRNLS